MQRRALGADLPAPGLSDITIDAGGRDQDRGGHAAASRASPRKIRPNSATCTGSVLM